MNPADWAWVEKASIILLLTLNLVALIIIARFIFKQLQERQWVPGWVYAELAEERDCLRVENKALRDVTLRAIKVTASAVGEQP